MRGGVSMNREGAERESQAGSALSAQSLTNWEIMTWAEIKSQMLNRLSHRGAPLASCFIQLLIICYCDSFLGQIVAGYGGRYLETSQPRMLLRGGRYFVTEETPGGGRARRDWDGDSVLSRLYFWTSVCVDPCFHTRFSKPNPNTTGVLLAFSLFLILIFNSERPCFGFLSIFTSVSYHWLCSLPHMGEFWHAQLYL